MTADPSQCTSGGSLLLSHRKGKKTVVACDQCHRHKLKCSPRSQGCARCHRLGIQCTSSRPIKRRGRRPTRQMPPLIPPQLSEPSLMHLIILYWTVFAICGF
ncbi:Zn(II)2Cys6 transcription factor domain-containing protein [Aspergillus vadensis CBS 113365]|uniref:Zn(2)-C6 fungal-type domain-containing protein n=1 Tax=Aspergillus vadensis (strain CBS 113365 / IMI 142717 / IBT 24658) TaxID=1448311 RepID=A0A319B0W9_ASPVC|nr:hypothetical protein BO88DRAFT_137277 [Aspergillus vadensis CBS 113365]PYH65765.1 hypothetical protein BO88DRAFT_137277 [Aspergillus vadensis CBS 113365]